MIGRTKQAEKLSLRLPDALLAELEAIAIRRDRSVSYLARLAITEWVKRNPAPASGSRRDGR